MLADAGRAGEADQIHPRVLHQHFARQRRVAAEDNIEHARREACLTGEFAKNRAHARRVGRRFQDDGAARE
jgi:hypothetical protein